MLKMKDFGFAKKNPSADSVTSAHPMFPHVIACPRRGNLSLAQQTVISEKWSFKTGRSCPGQDTCSSQSFFEVPCVGETNQCKLGGVETYMEADGRQVESSLTVASYDLAFASSEVCVPFHHVNPFFGGFATATYRPQLPQPQVMGICSNRVPLPFDVTWDDRVYVNSKQYRAILRRRQHRAKRKAQNKITKARKYLHESRHLHALRRARGSGGRFLSKKGVQESTLPPSSNKQSIVDDNQLRSMSNSKSKTTRDESTTITTTSTTITTNFCFDMTTASKSDDIFEQPTTGLFAFSSQIIDNDDGNFDVAAYGGIALHLMRHNKR